MAPLLLDQIVCYLPSTFSQVRYEQLVYLIETQGGTVTRKAEEATHVVTNSHRFEGWQAFEGDSSRPVCTVQWLERSVLFGKLQPVANYSADPSMLFSGVVGCAADLPHSDVVVLSGGIGALGGQWRNSLTKDVTHLFTLCSDSEKYQQAIDYKQKGMNDINIVVPHWFDDVMKLGMGTLNIGPYEWPDPVVLQPENNDKEKLEASKRSHKLDANKKLLFATAVWNVDTAASKLSPKEVFGKRRVLLSATLELGERREGMEEFVERADGVVVPYEVHDNTEDVNEEAAKIDECDIFVCKYRHGAAYYKAERAGKTIASLAWLFHVISIGILTSPLSQLLHYPVPKKAVEGFSDQEITITNFTGEAREYLKNLITTMGATFTPSMSAKNTVLIAGQSNGTKADKARAWQIPVVNHLWLEDCFIQWKKITVGVERYIHFPQNSDLAPRLGERELDVKYLAELDQAHLEEEEGEEEERGAASVRGGLRTQDSARDAREAADIAMGVDDDPVPVRNDGEDAGAYAMDVDTPKVGTSPKTRRASRAEETRVARENSDDGDEDFAIPRPPKKTATRMSGRLKADVPLDKNTGEKENEREAQEKTVSSKKNKVQDLESEDDDEFPGLTPIKTKSKTVRYVRSDTDHNDKEDERKGRATVAKKSAEKAPRRRVESEDEEDEEVVLPKPSKQTLASSKKARRSTSSESDGDAPLKSPTKQKSGPSPRTLDSVVMPGLAAVKVKTNSFVLAQSPTRRSSALTKNESINIASSHTATASRRSTGTTKASASPARPLLKRAAATKASQQLHDTIMPDVRSYEAEMKKRRRQSSSSISVLPRDKDQVDDEEEEEEEEAEKAVVVVGKGKKKAKTQEVREEKPSGAGTKRKATSKDARSPKKAKKRKPGSVKVLTTQVTLSEESKRSLEKLGAKMVTKAADCTHLIAAKIARTEKFLCAMAVAPWILTEKWVYDSIDAGELLPEEPYFLQDKGQWNIDLKQSLERARKLKHLLLANRTFYVSPGITLDRNLLRNVISAFGAKYSPGIPTDRQLIIPMSHFLTCEEDRPLWESLADKHPIYNVDVLFTGVLKQHLDLGKPEFHIKGTWRSVADDPDSDALSEEA